MCRGIELATLGIHWQMHYQLSYYCIKYSVGICSYTCGCHVVEGLVEDVEVPHQHPHGEVRPEVGASLDQLQGAWQSLDSRRRGYYV